MPLIVCLVALLAAAAAAPPQDPKEKKPGYFSRARFETKYDKFKDLTTVVFKPLPLSGTMTYVGSGEMVGLAAGFQHPGEKMLQPVDQAFLGFFSSSKKWVFLKDDHCIFLVDGERIDLGPAASDRDVRLGGVSELITFTLPAESLNKIAGGKKVEVQVGKREYELKDHHLWALRELAGKMRPGP